MFLSFQIEHLCLTGSRECVASDKLSSYLAIENVSTRETRSQHLPYQIIFFRNVIVTSTFVEDVVELKTQVTHNNFQKICNCFKVRKN